MTGHKTFLANMIIQAVVAFALQPFASAQQAVPVATVNQAVPGATVNQTQVGQPPRSGTTPTINETQVGLPGAASSPSTIPPVAPPGRGFSNENDNVTTVDSFTEPGTSTLPIESPADNILASQIQNELIRQIPTYTAGGRQINSQSGHITIQGSVLTEDESRKIVNVIKRMPGVKSVRNNLTVEETGNTR